VRRFCGPPQSGNGGYVAGRLAAALPGTGAAAVRLFSPPPLERHLEIREEGEGVALFDGDARVAHARRVGLELDAPAPPDFEAAVRAAERYRGFEDPIFPTCFVCGYERGEGDGLRIFAGEREDGAGFAAPWIPDASLVAPGSDRVAPEFLWAALDCPGAFAFPQPEDRIILLGELQVALDDGVRAGERCVLTSWYLARDGRKHLTGSALHGEEGRCVGRARGIWIEIAPDAVPRS
jgi:hypothetical protein